MNNILMNSFTAMNNIVKNSVAFLSCLLLSGGLLMTAACSDSDKGEDVETPVGNVDFWGAKIPYTPLSVEKMPHWLQVLLTEPAPPSTYFMVCRGSSDVGTTYYVKNLYQSALQGYFYDADGQPLVLGVPAAEYVQGSSTDWVCIFYHE